MSANENDATGTEVTRFKHRSPNYPAIGLVKALERAQTIKEKAGRHQMSVGAAHAAWKYKAGVGDQNIAALKAYGLIEVQGKKDTRQIRLTEGAWRILGNAPNRAALLAEAALKPEIHEEIWEKYEGTLPADEVLRDYLVWERKFNEASVDSFIAQFRNTIAFAGLTSSDKMTDEDDWETNETQNTDEAVDAQKRDEGKGGRKVSMPEANRIPMPPTGQMHFPLYLSKGQQATLYVPSVMNEKEFDLLKKQIQHSLAVMEATAVIENEPSRADLERSRGTGEREAQHSLLDEGLDSGLTE